MPDKAMVDNNTDAISEEQAVVSQSSDATGQDALKQNFSAAVAYAQERMEKMSVEMNASADVLASAIAAVVVGVVGCVIGYLLDLGDCVVCECNCKQGQGENASFIVTQGSKVTRLIKKPDGSFTKSK